VVDLAAEREVAPDLGEIPDVRRHDRGEHDDGAPSHGRSAPARSRPVTNMKNAIITSPTR
jgi:hypothetical protein